jgi:hypothetical protein
MARRLKITTKVCIVCNKQYESKSAKQVCCSQTCNYSKWRKDNPERAKAQSQRAEEKRKGKNRYNSEKRKKWYQKRKSNPDFTEKLKRLGRNRSYKIKRFISTYKVKKGCYKCGYNAHPAALHLHHFQTKKFEVCNASSIRAAVEELKKCIVLCANCHCVHTFQEYQKKRKYIQEAMMTPFQDNVQYQLTCPRNDEEKECMGRLEFIKEGIENNIGVIEGIDRTIKQETWICQKCHYVFVREWQWIVGNAKDKITDTTDINIIFEHFAVLDEAREFRTLCNGYLLLGTDCYVVCDEERTKEFLALEGLTPEESVSYLEELAQCNFDESLKKGDHE